MKSGKKALSSALESVNKAYSRLRVSQYLAQKALTTVKQEEFWNLLAEHLTLYFSCDRVTIYKRGPQDQIFPVYAQQVHAPMTMKIGAGIAGHVADTQKHYLTNDPYGDPLFNPSIDKMTDYKSQNLLAFPLVYQGKTLGVVELLNKPGGFGKNDVDTIEDIGPHLVVFLVKFAAEERQEEMSRQMLQTEKMAAVGRLAAGVAHEINNPLSAILGFTQLLLRNLKDQPEAVKDLLIIDADSRRIRTIVQNLLGFSRISPPTLSKIKVPEIIQSSLSLVAHELKHRRIEIATDFDEGVPEIPGDANQLKQIFVNLIMNALQAMDSQNGGKISFRAWPCADAPCVNISVSDSGPGISPENLDKIFEPFFTTKEVGQGTGLGLYIILKIMDHHHGKITVESRPGGGTSFLLRLPARSGVKCG